MEMPTEGSLGSTKVEVDKVEVDKVEVDDVDVDEIVFVGVMICMVVVRE